MKKHKSIKKFKKKRILPSVLVLIIGLCFVAFIEMITIYLYMEKMIDDKIVESHNVNAVYADIIANNISEWGYLGCNTGIEDVIFQIEGVRGNLYCYNKEVIKLVKMEYNGTRIAIPKKANESQLVSEEGYISIDFSESEDYKYSIKYKEILKKATENVDNNRNEAVSKIKIWNVYESRDKESLVFIQNTIEINKYDIIYIVALCALYITIAAVIGIIFVGNVIAAIVNHNRMMAALYYDDKTGNNNWLYFKNRANKILKTGLVNRMNLLSKTNYAIVCVRHKKYDNYCTCFGGDIADELVFKMDKAIGSCVYKKETYARNVDSYFGMLVGYTTEEELQNRLQQICKMISTKLVTNDICLGVYCIPENGKVDSNDDEQWSDVVDHYFHHARIACDTNAQAGKSNIAFFDHKLLEEHLWEHKVESKMEQALINEDFKVYIQPKYNPKTKELKGVEALVRWIDEDDGFISPGRFIPIFEKNGFITKLDDYMISHVSKYQSEWIEQGYKVVPVSVNVSRAHFTQIDLAEHIIELIDQYKTPHEFIELELTESAFFDDKEALIRTINKMQEQGFQISMDDFGSGYSSLNSLKDLPLDVLKIDAEFFRGNEGDARGPVIVSKAIELAKELDMETVAEGIEKVDQVEFLAKAGCDMIQGFYFDKPMPTDEYVTRMKKNNEE